MMNIEQIKNLISEGITFSSPQIAEMVDTFKNLCDQMTPDGDESAMEIWTLIGRAKNPENITNFHSARSTCGKGVNLLLAKMMFRRRERKNKKTS